MLNELILFGLNLGCLRMLTNLKELESYLKDKIRYQQVSIFHLGSNDESHDNTIKIAECVNEIRLLKGLLTMVQDKLDKEIHEQE